MFWVTSFSVIFITWDGKLTVIRDKYLHFIIKVVSSETWITAVFYSRGYWIRKYRCEPSLANIIRLSTIVVDFFLFSVLYISVTIHLLIQSRWISLAFHMNFSERLILGRLIVRNCLFPISKMRTHLSLKRSLITLLFWKGNRNWLVGFISRPSLTLILLNFSRNLKITSSS